MNAIVSGLVLVLSVNLSVCLAESPKLNASPGAAAAPQAAGKVVWLTSLSEAKAEAAKRKVPILVDFSGSDWCGWCIKLDQEVFSTEAFRKYASEKLVLLLVDFPRSKTQSDAVRKQNRELADQFGIEGFPTILLLDAEGKLLERTSYKPGGGEMYVKHLEKLLGNKR